MAMREALKKFSLLLLCLPSVMMVTILTSSVVYIYQEYSYLDESLVTMILTIPNLTVLIGLVLSPILLKRISIKSLLVVGMLIYTVCGVAPAWCEHFYVLLFFRALLGIGCGIVIPLQTTLFATYPEKERAILLGTSTLLGCGISAVFVGISGMVATVNWRYVFLMYLINALVFVMTILFIPDNLEQAVAENSQKETQTSEASRYSDYMNVLIFYYALLIGSYMFVSILVVEMAVYLQNTGLGGSTEAGLIMGVYTVGTAVAGLLLEKYISILKGFALPMIFLVSAIGFVMLWYTQSLIPVGIAAVLIGTTSCLIACIVDYKLSCELPLSLYTAASAGVSFCVYIMNFVAPMVFVAFGNLMPGATHRSIFLMYAIIQAILFVVALVLPKVLLKRN